MNVGTGDVSSRRAPTRRIEDLPLVRGTGAYVADLVTPDTLHCAFVRSPVAHGKITEIDTSMATSEPGVVGIYSAEDLGIADIPAVTGRGPGAEYMTRPVLARDRVRFVGDAVAVVVAESAVAAADAADLVWVDVDELPVVDDPETAAEADTHLYEGGSNIAATLRLAEGPEPAGPPDVSSTVEVVSQRLAPVSIETLAVLADGSESPIHVWAGHQAPHRLRRQLSNMLGIDELRVTVPDVGGAFGMKGMFFPEYLVVTELARRLGRRVVWIQTRREQFTTGTHGRAQRHRVTLEGSSDGRISRAKIDLLAETGAYPHNGSAIPMFSRLVATGMYEIPRLEFDTTIVVTNRAPTGSYRGAGRPEAALAIERAIDAFAREAELDPIEVRRKNAIRHLPHTTPTGAVYDSGDYVAAIDMAMKMIDLDGRRAEQQRRLSEGGHPIGIGLGAFIERAGGAIDSGEYAKVEVGDGEVVVRTGSTDTGQGHATAWTQVAQQVFGDVPVRVIAKDTDEVADGVGTFASRSTQIGASAVRRMSDSVLAEAKKRAAEELEAAIADIEYEAGAFRVVGVPGTDVSLFDLIATEPLADEEMFVPGAQTFPYGAHAAVVEVVLETGEVRILDIVTVDDCGTVLNPMLVEGQLHGSLAQGLGQALFESIRYDESGQPLTASMMDYSMVHAPDVPAPKADHLEHPAPSNPLGAKGTGEAGCIGMPAAVLNAAIDALAPFGVTELQLPLQPHRVWSAIEAASGG